MSAEAMRDIKHPPAPLRPVRLGPADVQLDRKPDGTIFLRSPHPLGAYPDKLTQRLEHWAEGRARPRLPGAARGRRRLAHAQLRADAGAGARRRAGAAGAQAFARAADRDPVRQRHRARAARSRRHDDRRALRADLGALLADVGRLRQAEVDHGDADAGPGVRRRAARRSRARSRRPCRATSRSSSPPIRGERPATLFAELLAAKPTDAVDARARQGRPRHHRRNSCSPRARPAIPRASSTPSGCCAPTRR